MQSEVAEESVRVQGAAALPAVLANAQYCFFRFSKLPEPVMPILRRGARRRIHRGFYGLRDERHERWLMDLACRSRAVRVLPLGVAAKTNSRAQAATRADSFQSFQLVCHLFWLQKLSPSSPRQSCSLPFLNLYGSPRLSSQGSKCPSACTT